MGLPTRNEQIFRGKCSSPKIALLTGVKPQDKDPRTTISPARALLATREQYSNRQLAQPAAK